MIKLCKGTSLLLCLFALAIFAADYANAQIETGSVTGTVKDSSGAVMRGVHITLTGNATGVSQTALSTSTGTYIFDSVNVGQYTLYATAPGFRESVVNGLTINVQQTLTIDITLHPGGSSTQVVVTTTAPLLQTENAGLGQTVDSEMVNDLPLESRDWVSLAQISAGVSTAYVAQPSTDGGTTGSAYFVVNGVNMWQNDIRLNGIDDNIEMYGGSKIATNATITPPPDAIQQFRLQAGDFDAEFGHSTGGIVNAVTKSGTNHIHGDVWDYFRNNALQANSYFAKQQDQPVPPYRQNIFGGTLGGPIVIPRIYDGHDKSFFFISYEGLRAEETNIVYSPSSAELINVPTALEQSSNFTDLQDIINDSGKSTTATDTEGRVIPYGTVMDPATTRTVTKGVVDPVTGISSKGTGYVRDPFYTGGSLSGITDFTGLTQYLNQVPANRLDPNAVALLHNYPLPTVPNVITDNYFTNPAVSYNQDKYDGRIDHVFGPRDTGFISADYSHIDIIDQPELPGLIIGDVDGEAQSFPAWATAIGYNHVFSPTMTNEFHVGYDHYIENVRSIYGDSFDIPAQFGIEGIPQIPNNGGLPPIAISGLREIGVPEYNPTLETIHALEFMENLTKEHAAHVFKAGYQIDFIAGDITQPDAGRGYMDFNGMYTQATNDNTGSTGIADMLLTPIPTTLSAADNPAAPTAVAGAPPPTPYVEGGLDSYLGSNFSATNDKRYYMGAYLQDDWKILPTLTLNLGIRWDYASPYWEVSGRQANFIQSDGGNGPGGTYYMPNKTCHTPMSASVLSLFATDNITVQCTSNNAAGTMQFTNFAPRVGFNWRMNPTVVLRGGYGTAFGALANIGYGGTLGTNYPFIYNIASTATNNNKVPLLLSNGQTATMENTFPTINLTDSTQVDGEGLSLYGRQWNYKTPYVETYNFTFQKQFTGYDAFTIGYVGALGRHLDNYYAEHNSPTEILTVGTSVAPYLPLPDFAENTTYETTNATSNYNALQAIYQHQFHAGLNLISNYTWSKCLTDQKTQAKGTNSYRAPWLPGFGIKKDYGLCGPDAADIIHVAATYQVPVGHGRMYGGNMNGALDGLLGGWEVNFISSYQSGQPFTTSCATDTTADFGCNADVYPNVDMYAGPHDQEQWLNPAAFYNPPSAKTDGQTDYSILGGESGQSRGPSFFNLDASIFKDFNLPEKYMMQFRAEAYNALNSAQFAQPGTLNYTTQVNYSEITALRRPPRIIQLALKVFF